jgi:hypothetical protein
MINPAHVQRPEEASIIGSIVIGYSELHITLCHIAGLALGEKWSVLDALQNVDNEGTRLDLVNRLVRHKFAEQNMEAKFGEVIGAMRYCKSVRNQYAHAHWIVDEHNCLCFTSSRGIQWTSEAKIPWKLVTLTLLKEQQVYFEYTRRCLLSFEWALLQPNRKRPFPAHMAQPAKHIPVA